MLVSLCLALFLSDLDPCRSVLDPYWASRCAIGRKETHLTWKPCRDFSTNCRTFPCSYILTVWCEVRELALLDYRLFSYIDLPADVAHNIFQFANVVLFVGVVVSRVCRFPETEINLFTALNSISWLPLFSFFQGFRNLWPLIAAI
ncbi:hypothetical protein BJ742DRAFT_396002 [Cladochytrium replicatum]|nr:hypothetical protein BJ742DRAFT_396002 [Cladochytrium replicatum]